MAVRCWATVLKSKVAHYDPRPGDAIGIEYTGSKPNSDPKLADIELYEVNVQKPPGRPVAVPQTPQDAPKMRPRLGRTPGLSDEAPPIEDDDPGVWPECAEAAS